MDDNKIERAILAFYLTKGQAKTSTFLCLSLFSFFYLFFTLTVAFTPPYLVSSSRQRFPPHTHIVPTYYLFPKSVPVAMRKVIFK